MDDCAEPETACKGMLDPLETRDNILDAVIGTLDLEFNNITALQDDGVGALCKVIGVSGIAEDLKKSRRVRRLPSVDFRNDQ